jgi:dTDP-4-dehydrorhamnose 3,5-epimerase
MDKTINYETIQTFFDGRVVIRGLKTYNDSRGMVCETFRSDSDINSDSKMCYISETEPYIMRGPHEHVAQRDEFVSWKNHMCYMFYDIETKKSAYYITDPTKIINVSVKPGVLHAYRNLDNKVAATLNYPTALFMGEGKKGKTDEVRHEDRLKGKKAYVVLGANGRLGSAIAEKLMTNMGEYDFEIFPIYHRVNNSTEILKLLDDIQKATAHTAASEITIFNCIGVTNVQEATKKDPNLLWANADLPYLLGEYTGSRGMNLVHFSTDYVYQEIKEAFKEAPNISLSPYTVSKKVYEQTFKEAMDSGSKKQKHVKILRVANLFTSELDDANNIIQKISKNVNKFGEVQYDPNISIGPTHVNVVADWIFDNLATINNGPTFTNLASPDVYTIKELLDKFYDGYAKRVEKPLPFVPWFDKFRFADGAKTLASSEEYIRKLIPAIKNKVD